MGRGEPVRGTEFKGAAIGLVGVVVAAVAVAVVRTTLSDTGAAQSAGPIPRLPGEEAVIASGDPGGAITETGTETELGVFEEMRGWIVYPNDGRLEAVNPADPAERRTLELPAGLDVLLGGAPAEASAPMPAGWSADGTKLALSSEYFGDSFVMSADGSFTRETLGPRGCCMFVVEPWLSPDGTTGVGSLGPRKVGVADLVARNSYQLTLEPPLAADRGLWGTTWSADGSRIAFVAVVDQLGGAEPVVHVADASTGANEVLARLNVGHVRHFVWSPDDSQLLVVGGAPLPPCCPSLNPLVHPQATSLYRVATDGSGVREIASGYYVATAWSPDGAQIAAIEYSPSGRQLVVLNADGAGKRVLVELPGGELFTGVAWHPLAAQD